MESATHAAALVSSHAPGGQTPQAERTDSNFSMPDLFISKDWVLSESQASP